MSREAVDYCVTSVDCSGPSRLVDTCYGFTGGDKWRCIQCKGYCVVRPYVVPSKPVPVAASPSETPTQGSRATTVTGGANA